MGTQTEKITAIDAKTRGYHSSPNAYYRPAYVRTSPPKVNSVMTKNLSSVLDGIPGYMVSSSFVEKLSLKA